MNSKRSGFLLVEAIMAIAVLCGVITVMLFLMGKTTEVVAVDVTRVNAADYVEQVLDAVRHGDLPVPTQGTVELPARPAPMALQGEKCAVTVSNWPDDASLRKIIVKLSWTGPEKRPGSMSATTLVRISRLKFEDAK